MEETSAASMIARQLRELQADRSKSALMSAYVAVLTDDAGWSVEAVAGLLGASRQSISRRRQQGRGLLLEHRDELVGLPAPAAPDKSAVKTTRSGLRIPDAEAIAGRQPAWVRQELARVAATATGVPTVSGTDQDRPGQANLRQTEAKAAGQQQVTLRLLAGLLDELERMAAALRERRATTAWQLTCFDPRARQGLQKAGCWQPDEFFAARTVALAPAAELKGMDDQQLRALASERGVPEPVDLTRTREEYFEVTSQLITVGARRRAAVELRDELVRAYVRRDAGGRWRGVSEVAGWIGRTQSQVTQICDAG